MKNVLSALSLIAVAHQPAAAEPYFAHYPAYLSAGSLLGFCTPDKSDPNHDAKMQACYAFVMGVNDAIVDIYTARAEPMPYCMPVLRTPGELIDMIKPHLEIHKSEPETRAALLVREQLINAFPCPD